MDKTTKFYNENAQQFYDSTYDLDMSSFYRRFEETLPKKANILDAGCGSGRDSKYFLSKGHNVTAMDASEELCQKAALLIGKEVKCQTFQEINDKNIYDGIWCCASLLHVPSIEINSVMTNLAEALKPNGILYASFKLGDQQGERNGRFFNDMTEESLKDLISELPFDLKESWITEDVRPGRESEKWLNSILLKSS